jgi:predicted transposase YbfD/YdcC
VDVEAKTNEIPMFATLLDHIDLAGTVITADALHAQRAHA